ncbi:DNA ligase [Paenibacillus marchantiophytorum]|uniref:DNA ligase (ATP) n=1 Tax=Paenibacillus marchantiophytorum TaxID=1619310 RepID=A0ABQ1FJQ3_9BACL|nr:RNA ligase family protein [Paenibacillus marchantiophytorum]GGA15307.1 DNA ligase [Paenibacillus marchantiophytorum]
MDFVPITPFEPISTEELPSGSHFTSQIKWDGVRMLLYFDGSTTKLINRRGNERTLQYPELTHPQDFCSANSVILDGEIIALDQGKPSFYEIMRRDSARKTSTVTNAMRQVPITYMIFDILYCDRDWLTHLSLSERQAVLQKIIKPSQQVQLVANHSDIEALFQVVMQHDLEGIVIKDLNSPYLINGKDKRWLKKKIFKDLFAVVGGVTYRDKMVNSLLLGLYDDQNQLWYIGHAGTGKLTMKDWQHVTEKVQSIRTNERPFINEPERAKEAIWIEPSVVVKVSFLEWTPNKTLRHPSIQSFVQLDAKECFLNQN